MVDAHPTAVTKAASTGSSDNTRTLVFQSEDLGRDIDLLLMFEPPENAGGLYSDMFPICWKLISLSATGYTSSTVIYSAQTALYIPQVDSGNLVSESSGQPCETGQKCKLEVDARGNNYLTAAVMGTKGFIECYNDTGLRGEVGIGFINALGTKVEPAFIWTQLPNESILGVKLTPKLSVYPTSDYQETEIIRGEIDLPCLLSQNPIDLKPSTTFNVSIDNFTGEIVINAE